MASDRRKMPETADKTNQKRGSIATDLANAAKKAVGRGGDKVERVAKRFKVNGVDLFYGDLHAVQDVTMMIEPNEVTALIGSSGCGKTTMLRSLNRMHELTPGARVEVRSFSTTRTSTPPTSIPSRYAGWSGWSSRRPIRSRRCRSTRTSPPG